MDLSLLSQDEWRSRKREPLQKYKDYALVVGDAFDSIKTVTQNLGDTDFLANRPKAGLMRAAHGRAESGLEAIFYSYSAGTEISRLSAFFPAIVRHWIDYAPHHLVFHESPDSGGHKVPHLDLYDVDYWEALQLVCFAILLGHSDQLQSIMDLLIYENDDQDALLEDLVAPYLPGRPGSTVYTRQLPYRKTKKIFAAKPEQRAALMATYLDEWYDASRREPYHDRHKSSYFPGYWSLEAAAITFILGIDDSSYRDKKFYPKDLVDYARSVSNPPGATSAAAFGASLLRTPAGKPCPQAGWWFTPAKEVSRRYFRRDDVFPEIEGSNYGATFWLWSPDQSDPKL